MSKSRNKILITLIFIVTCGIVTKACEDLLSELLEGQAVQVHLEIVNTAGELYDNLGNSEYELYIDEVAVQVSDVELEGRSGGSDQSFILADSSISLFPEDPTSPVSEKVVPEDSYTNLRLLLEGHTVSESDQDHTTSSITVHGRINQEPFEYTVKEELDFDLDLSPPLKVGKNTDSLIVVTGYFDYSGWFKNSEGVFLNPADSANHRQINENIRSSFSLTDNHFDKNTRGGVRIVETGVKGDEIAEENAGAMPFTVILSESSVDTVKVSYKTADNSAKAGEDYVESSGLIVIVPGMTEHTIEVELLDDVTGEGEEKFALRLYDPVNADLNRKARRANGIIIDDDETTGSDSPGKIGIKGDVTAEEDDGEVVFWVSLSEVSEDTVKVDFTTSGDSAVAGEDYYETWATMTFLPGDLEQSVSIELIDDDVEEEVEDFILSLSNAVNAELDSDTRYARGIITDDDGS